MNECLRCGQAGLRYVTHVCMNALVPLPTTTPLDTSHWLYKAGYEAGYQAALRERDLSPMGKERRA